MTDKLKNKGDTLRGLIAAGGNVMDKALDKSSEVATSMIDNMTRLTSKLSDDIGLMADRILAMEERIGKMADRIVHTEELMTKLTAALANNELDLDGARYSGQAGPCPPLLDVSIDLIASDAVPDLRISGDPKVYMLYVSSSPLFYEQATVVSRIAKAEDLSFGWRRSMRSLIESRSSDSDETPYPMTVSVAVRACVDDEWLSPLSNSVDLTVS